MAEYRRENDDQKALEAAEAALQDPALSVEATCALAAIYYRAGALGYAIKMLASLMESTTYPNDIPEVLAVLYAQAGCLSDALYLAKLATTEKPAHDVLDYFGPSFPKFADAFAQVSAKPLMASGMSEMNAGNLDRAKFLVQQHLIILPNDVEALDAYARILTQLGEITDAIGILRSVSTLAGPSATLLSRMGHCLIQVGDFQEGLACHHEAVARAPTSAPILGAAMADMRFFDRPEAAATGIPDTWATQLASAAPKTVRTAPKYAGASPVRICYLCSSLDSDELRGMVGAIARSHDRSRVTVVGFGKGEAEGQNNQWSRGAFDLWRDVSSLDVTTMGALIRGEGIHVVIDADGLLAPARSSLFQRNTAPLQVSWLHAPVTGRAPGNYVSFSPGSGDMGEGRLALAGGRYCLSGSTGAAPVASPAPMESGETITFGVELSRAELNPRLAMAWGRILQAVPGSVLLFRDTGMFGDQASIDRIVSLFGNAGVSHRIDVVKGGDRAEFAANIDIALLPFPSANILAYGEILCGGAPVVALSSSGSGADMGAFLTQAGLGDALVAADVAAYVAAASALAGDKAGLVALRRGLPERLASVPSFSAKGFARMVEDAVIGALGQLQA
ncbi:hypothetical protein CU669_03295 [Paramagnetospirillum kuznetsovii]|uniref:protein O-GlcNAc transferase n=2 Tax=Paramagnetospirillum kuznetsovii TaxID=2053833 RepID=A0A364P1H7_9PROT|nr:hypothetical protein CU669_03295 [Paramagnetospirillum kuznetsovii]